MAMVAISIDPHQEHPMASRKTSPPKPAKAVVMKATVKPRPAKAVVKDLQTGLRDLQAIDPEHPWARLLKDAVVAIQEQQRLLGRVLTEQQAKDIAMSAQIAAIAIASRDGMSQVRGELEQIRTHLARFLDAGIRERSRDERIEMQLAGINERLKERSRDGRVVRHGKTITAEELSRQLDATERAKDEQICGLAAELGRVRAELEAARAPLDRRPMPPPRKSWRTNVAENATAAPLD